MTVHEMEGGRNFSWLLRRSSIKKEQPIRIDLTIVTHVLTACRDHLTEKYTLLSCHSESQDRASRQWRERAQSNDDH